MSVRCCRAVPTVVTEPSLKAWAGNQAGGHQLNRLGEKDGNDRPRELEVSKRHKSGAEIKAAAHSQLSCKTAKAALGAAPRPTHLTAGWAGWAGWVTGCRCRRPTPRADRRYRTSGARARSNSCTCPCEVPRDRSRNSVRGGEAIETGQGTKTGSASAAMALLVRGTALARAIGYFRVEVWERDGAARCRARPSQRRCRRARCRRERQTRLLRRGWAGPAHRRSVSPPRSTRSTLWPHCGHGRQTSGEGQP